MEEIEVKFLDINVVSITKKLKKLGAKKAFEKLYKRKVFDYSDWRLDKKHSWVRLRDEGEAITLTYKRRLGTKDQSTGIKNDEGMEEVEIEVSDFEQTATLLHKIGLVDKFYLENKRTRYLLNGVEIDIDTWPLIPAYLEIEANSWDEIDKTIKQLDLNPKDKKIMSATQVYKLYGINDKDYSLITFEKQIKRKK